MIRAARPVRALAGLLLVVAALAGCSDDGAATPRAGGSAAAGGSGGAEQSAGASAAPSADGSLPSAGAAEGREDGGGPTGTGASPGSDGGTVQPPYGSPVAGAVPQGPPARVLFGVFRQEAGGPAQLPSVMTALPDGSGRAARQSAQPFPLTQVSRGVVATTTPIGRTDGSVPRQQGIVLRYPDRTQKLVTRGGFDDAPAWSPDGRALAYRSRVVDGDQQREVVRLLSRDGVDAGALSVPPRGQTDGPPVWSPDGASIATVRTTLKGRDLTSRIVLLTFDGKGPRTLVEGEWSDLAFSPDGRTLAAVKAENGVRKDLWIVDLAGRGTRRVTQFAQPGGIGEVVFCGQRTKVAPAVALPVWAPDGRSVAYLSSYPHVRQGSQEADVEVVDVARRTYTTAYAAPKATCPAKGEPQTYLRSRLYGWVR